MIFNIEREWARYHKAFPDAESYPCVIVTGITGGNPITEPGSTENVGTQDSINFKVHPDLSITCDEGWTPKIEDGNLLGFVPVTA